MRQVRVETPGTCGEYIQGWYAGQPCLISSPIDRFSRLTICEGSSNYERLKPKTKGMVDQIFERYVLRPDEKKHLQFKMESDIPIEKGMASSTADIAGMAAGLSAYFELGLTEKEIGKLCTNIEPSDNLMFKKLNLYNHITGDLLKNLEGQVEADIIIIDFNGGIDTMTFNETSDDYSDEDLAVFSGIVDQFKKGLDLKCLKAIGEACTQSAMLNQKRLKKPYLELIKRISDDFGGLGTIVGHSGTVIGVMYQRADFKEEAFTKSLKQQIPASAYAAIHKNRLIPGGVRIAIQEN